jgi:tetratricopeptide (TPR) repeat protein
VQAPDPELYDLRRDLGERANVFQTQGTTARALSHYLTTLVGRSSAEASAPTRGLNSAEAERLRSLGYVSGQVDLGTTNAGADPKAHIAEYVTYVSAFTEGLDSLHAGQSRRAERMFERLVKSFPRSFEAHEYLGRSRAARGAHVEALRCFETAQGLSPQTAMIDFDAARSFAALGDFRQALTRVQRGLALEPDTFYGYLTEGQIQRAAGQREAAISAFRRALALNPGLPVAEYELGALAEQAGNRAEALDHYQRALVGDAGMTQARAAVTRLGKRQ